MRKFRPAKTLPEANARLEMTEHMLEQMHAHHKLALQSRVAADPAVMEPVEVEVPPDEVMAAMRTISPTDDMTYQANFAYWAKNKERAKAFPKDFAREIIEGVVWEPARTEIVVIPDHPVPVS